MKYGNLIDVETKDLRYLCRSCHYRLHEILKENKLNKYCFGEMQIIIRIEKNILNIDLLRLKKRKKIGGVRNLFKEYGITTYGMKRNRVLELKEYILEKCRDALEAKLEIQRLQRLNRLPSSQFVKHRKNKKKKVLV